MGIRIRIAFERLSRREREPLVEGASPCEVRADWTVPGLCCCLRPSEGVRQLAKAMLDAGLELPLDVGRIEFVLGPGPLVWISVAVALAGDRPCGACRRRRRGL